MPSATPPVCPTQALAPFQFETHALRVQTDEQGNPWFNVNDVCEVLEFGNARQALASHVHEDDQQKLDIIDSLGRTQQANHVNESGLYALIFGSTKETAKRFKRWITSEVIPSIRKTGSYTTPVAAALPSETQDKVAAIVLLGEWIERTPGVRPGIAKAATLACIRTNTGIDTEDLRKALPAAAPAEIGKLNPTALGKEVGLSAKAVNERLASLGLQVRGERGWELTEKGKPWGEAIPFSRNGHAGYQILWIPSVAMMLREVA